ncbi:MAG TPA: UDP-glucose 4-epimerase GalE [Dehalococcoidia bacterium]|nr:UDP-glucose 4-epimerase GalE [Dehalococcoidia bacterium]
MRILVIGGAGYIGSVTVDQLVEADHDVTVLDSLVSGHAGAVHPDVELATLDARDESGLGRLFAAHSFDAVINYGGYIQAGESVQHPGRYFSNNVTSVIAILNAMVTYDVKRLVFSSSAAVYGEPESCPITEDAPKRPINPYGMSKLMAEQMFPWFESRFGIHHVSLRYFNAAGATPTRGEDHRPETHLIPNVLQVALGRRDSFSLFGTDYPTRDGTCVRDYVHVSDLAAAHLLALGFAESGSGAFNLGNGDGFTNREVIGAARRVTGHAIPVTEEPRRPGDPAELYASNDRAKRELGWHIEYTDLDEIVDSAWRWHQANPDGYTQ